MSNDDKKPSISSSTRLDQAERLADLGFWEWDIVADQLSYCSEGYARMLGMSVAETLRASTSSKADYRFVHPEDIDRYVQSEERSYYQGTGVDIEYRIVRPDGDIRHLYEKSEVIKNEDDEVIRTTGIVQDITGFKRIQEELTRTLVDSRRAERLAKLGTYEWDWELGRMVACSEEFARIRGLTIDEALSLYNSRDADTAFIHPDDRERYRNVENAALANGEGYAIAFRLLPPNGQLHHMLEVCDVRVDHNGSVIRSMGSVQDITDQVDLREQLHQSHKLEAVGQLSGGIAHDFNNMLTVIMGNVSLVQEKLDAEHPGTRLLSSVMRVADRAATLTQRLLAFSRKQSLEMKVIDLQAFLLDMREVLQRTLGETIDVTVSETRQSWFCYTDPIQFESAILNLAINARDAMPEGGSLNITLEERILKNDSLLPDSELKPGRYVQISIRDNGTGMTPESVSQAFDPFYTTKDVGQGTGLGLSMVYGFVKQYDGHVSIDSEAGEGTHVQLYLPLVR